MKDQNKTKAQLIAELKGIGLLGQSSAVRNRTTEPNVRFNSEIKFIPNVLTNKSQDYSRLETKAVVDTKEFQEKNHTVHLVTNEAPLNENQ